MPSTSADSSRRTAAYDIDASESRPGPERFGL